jgi:hypothetical protein
MPYDANGIWFDANRPPIPPFQLSKFSMKDRGLGRLTNNFFGAAGRVAGYLGKIGPGEDMDDAARAEAAK